MPLNSINHLPTILAQTATDFRAIEYDLPEQPLEWLLYVGGFALITLIGLRVHLRDTNGLHAFWRSWLLILRLGALAGIVVIALNPQERTQKMAFRPSQVAVLIDRSLSMRFPEDQPAGISTAESTAMRTRSAAVAQLLSESGLIAKLRESHAVSVYTFDSQLNGPHKTFRSKDPRARSVGESSADSTGTQGAVPEGPSVAWSEVLEPIGLETRLGESLSDLIRSVNGQSLSGIVVIGDGAANAGVDPQSAIDLAREFSVQVLTVGVGSTAQPVNVQVAGLQAPSDVQSGDAFEIAAFIQAQGLSGKEAEVSLLGRPEDVDGEPQILTSKQIVLGEDGIPTRVLFEQLQNQAGVWEYFVRTNPPAGTIELSGDDNERRKSINVVDRKTRVMVVAGGPMRDYRFVRNMLFRHAAIQTDVWLQSSDPAGAISQESNKLLTEFPDTKESLFEYDVILAFDPDWSALSPEQIDLMREWLFAQAGGLILVAGDVFTPAIPREPTLEKIHELYPVILERRLRRSRNSQKVAQAWKFDFTREGLEAGFLDVTEDLVASSELWDEFTGVYSSYPTEGAKAGATTYAYFSDPEAQNSFGQPILLASQYYGAGRTIYLGSPEMWRLRTIDEVYYDRFWTKVIREAGQARLKRGNNRGTLLLERTQYVLGQTVRVRGQILNPQFEPFTADSVTADVYDPQGRPMVPPVRMQTDTGRPGQFVGNFRVSIPGVWRIELPIPQSRDLLSEKIDVVLPNLETDNARQNAQLLRQIAEDTSGAYFPIKEAAEGVPNQLSDRSLEIEIDQQLRTLWDRRWVMYLLAALLSVEWLSRKLLKLA